MGRKYIINTENGPSTATGAELRGSCTPFQWKIWKRTRHSAACNNVPFYLAPTDFPQTLPTRCPVIGNSLETIEDAIVARWNTAEPYSTKNFYICSRRAYNALNASLSTAEWSNLMQWVLPYQIRA